jgi:predicted dehydrogenase
MAKDTFRVGVIGCGGIAQHHLKAIKNLEDTELIAISEVVPERLEQQKEKWEVEQGFIDYEEMLEKVELDAVHVCTFNQAHAAPSIAAMKAGLHVMVEKPMSAKLSDSLEMVKTAHETGKNLHVAIIPRFGPMNLAAKGIVDSGDIGEIYYAETVADRRRGVPGGSFLRQDMAGLGAVADIGIYALDAALHIMGFPKPVAVSGMSMTMIANKTPAPKHILGGLFKYNHEEIEVDEFATGWIRFENGAVLVFKTSWAMHMDTLGGTFFLGDKGGIRLSPEFKVFRDEWGYLVDITPQVATVERQAQFDTESRHFYNALREGQPSPVDPDSVLISDVIIDGIVRSARQGGGEVSVEVPTFE